MNHLIDKNERSVSRTGAISAEEIAEAHALHTAERQEGEDIAHQAPAPDKSITGMILLDDVREALRLAEDQSINDAPAKTK